MYTATTKSVKIKASFIVTNKTQLGVHARDKNDSKYGAFDFTFQVPMEIAVLCETTEDKERIQF